MDVFARLSSLRVEAAKVGDERRTLARKRGSLGAGGGDEIFARGLHAWVT
jgi:hypothetical protein